MTPRARWILAHTYTRQPDGLSVRPRLAVLDRRQGGVIWIGRDTRPARSAAYRLAAHLNRRPR